MEGMENGDRMYMGQQIPVQPGIRPMVDPEALGEVDPSRYVFENY